jgi:hypothetical protein
LYQELLESSKGSGETYPERLTGNKNNKLDDANRKKICKMGYSDPDLIYGEKHGIYL